ncbi:putative F-box protein At4g22660 [Dendrobium catenatum]|uniref:putative F-box protein At4g22660 n=1 Tax=Dendrobium catenatum TaxID=906689 RepID=UPI0009F53C79|nr:putative F-box protein At4g22660 [Dendrobium catenatum]
MAWSDLPIDILRCISSYLSIVDLVRLSVVCTLWNLTLTNYALLRFQCRPSPWLLLPNDVGEASDTLTFYDVTIEEEEEVSVGYQRRFSSLSSHIYGRRCFGSKDGWLVTLDKIDLQPQLFNPLTKAELLLPSLFTIPKDHGHIIEPKYAPDGSIRFFCNETSLYFTVGEEGLRDIYFHKIIVSSNDLFRTTVVIYGFTKALALARPGDQTWVIGPQLAPYTLKHNEQFEDVYYHDEDQRFYAITHFSMVVAFDLNGQNVELICPTMQNPCWRNRHFDYMYYIVFLSGSLLKIERAIKIYEEINRTNKVKTTGFIISKSVPVVVGSSYSYPQWVPIKDLGGYSLFVGCNQTFYLHHKVAPGIRPNCIYFADHLSNMLPENVSQDVGLFELRNGQFEYFFDSDSPSNWPPSIWFIPTLSIS